MVHDNFVDLQCLRAHNLQPEHESLHDLANFDIELKSDHELILLDLERTMCGYCDAGERHCGLCSGRRRAYD